MDIDERLLQIAERNVGPVGSSDLVANFLVTPTMLDSEIDESLLERLPKRHIQIAVRNVGPVGSSDLAAKLLVTA